MSKPLSKLTGSITAAAQSVSFRVRGLAVLMQLTGTFGGHNAAFEGSINSTDGVNGVWVPLTVWRSTNMTETTTGVLGAAPAYTWKANIAGYSFVRIRATAHASGTAVWDVREIDDTGDVPVTNIASQVAVVGQGPEDSAVAGSAVRTAGRVRTAHPTTFVSGDSADVTITAAGQQLVKQGGVQETAWNASAALTTTTPVALAAAAGAGLKRHITGAQVINTGAATVELILLDGVTERFRLPLPINVPVMLDFAATHLLVAANAALNANLSATGTVRINAQGYTAP